MTICKPNALRPKLADAHKRSQHKWLIHSWPSRSCTQHTTSLTWHSRWQSHTPVVHVKIYSNALWKILHYFEGNPQTCWGLILQEEIINDKANQMVFGCVFGHFDAGNLAGESQTIFNHFGSISWIECRCIFWATQPNSSVSFTATFERGTVTILVVWSSLIMSKHVRPRSSPCPAKSDLSDRKAIRLYSTLDGIVRSCKQCLEYTSQNPSESRFQTALKLVSDQHWDHDQIVPTCVAVGHWHEMARHLLVSCKRSGSE